MSSDKQIKANKSNSEKSTGPKTETGKTIVSMNALKHGLLASETLLPWESRTSLEELSKDLFGALEPTGELEVLLVDRIVSLVWRLRRAGKIETGIYAWRRYSLQLEGAIADVQSYVKNRVHIDLENAFPHETVITNAEKHSAALGRLCENSRLANSELAELGRTFVGDANSLATLHRYETGLERSLLKTLHELQRLQAKRQGDSVPPPFAIELHGEGET